MVIVLLSVGASVGFFGLVGVPATLIIFEIIPFLVLAVGVDNIFILVQTYQRDPRRGATETHAEHVGRVVGEVAPSMLLSSVAESTCFFLGALSDMPAVRAFALYAGMALLIDFLMQITCFVSLLALDMARQESNRYDLMCCVKAAKRETGDTEGSLFKVFKYLYAPFLMRPWVRPAVVIIFFGFLCTSLAVAPSIDVGLDQEISMPDDSYVLKYFGHLKTFLSVGPPFYIVVNTSRLQYDYTKKELQNRLCGSSGCDSDSLTATIKQWSKQSETTFIASPAMSWIDDYFAYMVADNCCAYDPNTLEVCQSNPVPGKKDKKPSKAVVSAASSPGTAVPAPEDEEDEDDFFEDFEFEDDFFGGSEDDTNDGHGVNQSSNSPIPMSLFHQYDEFYYYDDDEPESDGKKRVRRSQSVHSSKTGRPKKCKQCERVKSGQRPSPQQFRRHLRWFLEDNPGKACISAGRAAYKDCVRLSAVEGEGLLPEYGVTANSFMAFHSILKKSSDYTEALRWSQKLVATLSESVSKGLEEEERPDIFAYSVFYVFYEQYLTMWADTIESLVISLLAIFLVTFVLMGFDLPSSAIILLVLGMIIVNLLGLMYWWSIQLNAVSLVNLVMAVGISVEFVSHITRAFSVCVAEDRVARAEITLFTMGSSVSKVHFEIMCA